MVARNLRQECIVYRLWAYVCVCICKVHTFQVVYLQRPVKLERAVNAQSRTFTLIAWNANTEK